MKLQELKSTRKRRKWTQQEAAVRLGLSQSYLSMLENGRRWLTPRVARKLARAYELPPTALPLSEPTVTSAPVDAQELAEQVAALGYPGFAYLRSRRRVRKKNPAEVLLGALAQGNLEPRLTEALPWLVFHYWDLDADWLLDQVKRRDLQNRLGFVVTLARRLANKRNERDARTQALAELEQRLDQSRLAREETLCQAAVSEAERRWLANQRSEEAKYWGLLTDWRPEMVRYVE